MSVIQKLIDFRDRQASLEGVENYKVLQYKTIEEIARTFPLTLEELDKIKGIGPAKLKKYGKQILEIVQQYTNLINHTDENLEVENPKPEAQNLKQFQHSKGENFNTDEREKQAIRVGEYLEYLNGLLSRSADVKIIGEITGAKVYPSGVYFSLKDKEDESILGCYLPSSTYRGLGILIEDGMEVAVEGVPRLVRRNGRFQFSVENLELVGEGAMKKAYELLKAKLEGEGLFARKRDLPEFINSIGIITSRAGAVIHDFRNNLPKLGLKVYLKDVRVEGSSSAGMIINALQWFNSASVSPGATSALKGSSHVQGGLRNKSGMWEGQGIDVLVIMRGGGSLEDMQAFNNEQVVRAIFASQIPTILAIGHDLDVPLAQLVADHMVSTPTAAAKLIESTWGRVFENLPALHTQILNSFDTLLTETHYHLKISLEGISGYFFKLFENFKTYSAKVLAKSTWYKLLVAQLQERVRGQKEALLGTFANTLERLQLHLAQTEKIVIASSPLRLLELGYSIVRSGQGQVIKSIKNVSIGSRLVTQVADGNIESQVVGAEKRVQGNILNP